MAEYYLHSEPRTSSIPVLHTKGTHYEVGYDVVKFGFFEKTTKFDKISILLMTNKFVFLCFPPNFEFSVSYSCSFSGAP